MGLPRTQDDYTVYIDERDKRIGGVVLQKYLNRTDIPIWYWYLLLDSTEKSYVATHCKCFAVV